MILSTSLSLIFFTLASIHLYWAVGGKFGWEESLPTKETGERVLNPKKTDSALVGLGLITLGIFYLWKADIINFNQPYWVLKYGSWIIPILFIVRAIGEFKYVGFFKKVKKTNFAKLDSKFFSPLCLLIGIVGIAIELVK